jgi:hypothetical protein
MYCNSIFRVTLEVCWHNVMLQPHSALWRNWQSEITLIFSEQNRKESRHVTGPLLQQLARCQPCLGVRSWTQYTFFNYYK